MGNSLDICVETDALTAGEASLTLTSDALADAVARRVDVKPGVGELWFRGLPLAENVRRWDEEDGNLYTLTATLGAAHGRYALACGTSAQKAESSALMARRIFLRARPLRRVSRGRASAHDRGALA